MMKKSGWCAVDLDGTLAKYESWKGTDHIGDPVPAMVDRVRRLIADGWEVRIMTARVSGQGHDAGEVSKTHEAISRWTKLHIGVALTATCRKDFAMVCLYDDRAIGVEPNTGKLLSPDFLLTEPA